MMLFAFIGALALWIFVVHCLTVPEPFLNPRLLLDRNFSIGVLLAFVMGMLNFASIVLFPTLLHDLRGYPDNAIAMLIAARGVGNWTAFLFIAQLTRIAPRLRHRLRHGASRPGRDSGWPSSTSTSPTPTCSGATSCWASASRSPSRR